MALIDDTQKRLLKDAIMTAEASQRTAGTGANSLAQKYRDAGIDPGYYVTGDIARGAKSNNLTLESTGERYLQRDLNYYYGRDPRAAQAAADRAQSLGGYYSNEARSVGDHTAASLIGQANAFNVRSNQAWNRAPSAAYGELMAAARQGEGPSAAMAQLQAGTNQSMANQLALARSGRGMGESAASMRQAGLQNAAIAQEAANQAALLRAQENQAYRNRQLQAYGMAGQQYLSERELSDRTALGYSGAAQTGLTGAGQASMQGVQIGAQTQMTAEQLANQIQATALQGRMGYEEGLQQMANAKMGIGAQDADRRSRDLAAYIGAGAQTAAAAFTASDARAKKDITPVEPKTVYPKLDDRYYSRSLETGVPTARFADALVKDKPSVDLRYAKPYSYEYKDPERHGEGRYVGPMAQDLEQIPGVVKEGRDGLKQVDTSRLAMASASALGEQQSRTQDLDARLRTLEAMADPRRLGATEYPSTSDVRAKRNIRALDDDLDSLRVSADPRRLGPTEYPGAASDPDDTGARLNRLEAMANPKRLGKTKYPAPRSPR